MFEVHGPERKLRRLEGHMIMDRPGRPGPRSRGREIPAAPAEGGKIGNPGIFGKLPKGFSSSTMRACGLHKQSEGSTDPPEMAQVTGFLNSHPQKKTSFWEKNPSVTRTVHPGSRPTTHFRNLTELTTQPAVAAAPRAAAQGEGENSRRPLSPKIGDPGNFGKSPNVPPTSAMRPRRPHKAAVKAVAGVEGGFSEIVLFWWGANVCF